MRTDEFDLFAAQLKQLCATLGKAYTDPLVQAYWRALRDVSLADFEERVGTILLNASAETKFPKPSHLRSNPAPRPALSADPAIREAELRAIAVLEWLRRVDLSRWFEIIGNRNAARIVRSLGNEHVFFDSQEMCWRRC